MGFLKDIVKDLTRDVIIYIVVHEHPDGDAIGSQAALTLYLRAIGWEVFAVRAEQISKTYDHFTKDVPVRKPEDISDQDNNVFIALDCSTKERIPETMRSYEYLAIVDHHPEMKAWSTYQKIATSASSTCELLMDLLVEDGYRLNDPRINEALYLGLLTDSGNFSHSNISRHTFRCAENLVAAGVKPYKIIQLVFNNKTPEQLKLQSLFLNNIQMFSEGAIAVSILKPQDYIATNTCHNDTEGFVNQLLTLKNAKIAVFIEYNTEKVGCSMRSSDPSFAVNQVAKKYGGGGHVCAAACKIDIAHFNFKDFINDLDSLLKQH